MASFNQLNEELSDPPSIWGIILGGIAMSAVGLALVLGLAGLGDGDYSMSEPVVQEVVRPELGESGADYITFNGISTKIGLPADYASWQREWDGSLDLPFSDHASKAHADEGGKTPEEVRDEMKRKLCRPIDKFFCTDQIKLICPLFPDNPAKDSLWAGLIIGIRGPEDLKPVIVTGYVAPFSYWMSSMKRDGCTYMMP